MHTSLGQFELNPFPIHHPNDLDLSLIHLKNEETALAKMDKLGVEILHMRDFDEAFSRGEEVSFSGFEVAEEDISSHPFIDDVELESVDKTDQVLEHEEDTRTFLPYNTTGSLIFSSQDRFLASTPGTKPLPQGLCGGPTIDKNNRVCGVVEGIVPLTHEDERLAGSAVFIPSLAMKLFLDWAEKNILQKVMPDDLFQRVEEFKEGKEGKEGKSGKREINFREKDYSESRDEKDVQRVVDQVMKEMRETHSPEEVTKIMSNLDRERDEVIKIMNEEGGDLDEVIERVRSKQDSGDSKDDHTEKS